MKKIIKILIKNKLGFSLIEVMGGTLILSLAAMATFKIVDINLDNQKKTELNYEINFLKQKMNYILSYKEFCDLNFKERSNGDILRAINIKNIDGSNQAVYETCGSLTNLSSCQDYSSLYIQEMKTIINPNQSGLEVSVLYNKQNKNFMIPVNFKLGTDQRVESCETIESYLSKDFIQQLCQSMGTTYNSTTGLCDGSLRLNDQTKICLTTNDCNQGVIENVQVKTETEMGPYYRSAYELLCELNGSSYNTTSKKCEKTTTETCETSLDIDRACYGYNENSRCDQFCKNTNPTYTGQVNTAGSLCSGFGGSPQGYTYYCRCYRTCPTTVVSCSPNLTNKTCI